MPCCLYVPVSWLHLCSCYDGRGLSGGRFKMKSPFWAVQSIDTKPGAARRFYFGCYEVPSCRTRALEFLSDKTLSARLQCHVSSLRHTHFLPCFFFLKQLLDGTGMAFAGATARSHVFFLPASWTIYLLIVPSAARCFSDGAA